MSIRFEVVSGTEKNFESRINEAVQSAKENGESLRQINYSAAVVPISYEQCDGTVETEVIHSALLTFGKKG